MRFLCFLGLLLAGFVIIRYNKWIVDQTNIRFLGLQRIIGPGREYDVWKFIGVIFVTAGVYVLVKGLPF